MVSEIEPIQERRGRPTVRTQENRDRILQVIRAKGFAFSRAAESAGVSDSSASEWKLADPEFAEEARRAEAEWLSERVQDLLDCRTKWGTCDPKALELLLRRFPEFRQHQEVTQTSTSVSLTVNVDPASMAQLQARHAERLQRLVGVPILDKSEAVLTDSGTLTVLPPESA